MDGRTRALSLVHSGTPVASRDASGGPEVPTGSGLPAGPGAAAVSRAYGGAPAGEFPVVDARPAAAAATDTDRVALDLLQDLLRVVASTTTPVRLSAVNYTEARATLMAGALRPLLPGFVLQCVSIFKFHEFINLYDARADARLVFLRDAFRHCQTGRDVPAASTAKRVYDVFDDPDF